MPPDSRSASFIFHRDNFDESTTLKDKQSRKNFRQRLQDRFDKEPKNNKSNDKDSSDKPWHNISLGQVSTDSKRAFKNGADKITKTLTSVKTTFGSFSQVCNKDKLNLKCNTSSVYLC